MSLTALTINKKSRLKDLILLITRINLENGVIRRVRTFLGIDKLWTIKLTVCYQTSTTFYKLKIIKITAENCKHK